MHLDVTTDVLISQLGYTNNEQTQQQAIKIIENTKDFDKFAKHIISFNDQLKKINSFIAISNSKPYLKIKCGNSDATKIVEEFHKEVEHFKTKYNLDIEQIPNKDVYYILGKI